MPSSRRRENRHSPSALTAAPAKGPDHWRLENLRTRTRPAPGRRSRNDQAAKSDAAKYRWLWENSSVVFTPALQARNFACVFEPDALSKVATIGVLASHGYASVAN